MASVSGGSYSGLSNTGANETPGFGQQLANSISAALNNGTLASPNTSANPSFIPVDTYGATVLGANQTSFQVRASTNQVSLASSVAGAVTVYGSGGANQLVLGDNTPLSFNSSGGSGAIVTGDGNNLLGSPSAGGGAFSVRTGAGNDTITFVTGNNTINAGTGNNLILTGTTGGTSSSFVGITGNDTVQGAGIGTDTVALTTGTAYVAERSKNLLFIGNASTGGAATVLGGTGSDSVGLGFGGGSVFGGTGGNNRLAGGTGSAASYVQGGGSGDVLFSKSGPTTLVAGAGNETLVGAAATGQTTYTLANFGTDLVFGGAANELFAIGNGSEAGFTGLFNITTGAGADTVSFGTHVASNAFVVITDFNAATDRLAGLASQQASVTTAAATAGSTITLNDGTQLQFSSAVNLTGSNFV